MKFKHLKPEANARIGSLSELVKKEFSNNLQKTSELDLDTFAYSVKQQLSENGVAFEIINTKRCFGHCVLFEWDQDALSKVYIINPQIYSRKNNNYGLMHELGHVLLHHFNRALPKSEKEDEANYFAEKTLGYSPSGINITLGQAKYIFLHPIRFVSEYRLPWEQHLSHKDTLKLAKNPKLSFKEVLRIAITPEEE